MRGGKRAGAGRKPGNPMVMYFIRVPAELKEKLDKIPPDTIRAELSRIKEEVMKTQTKSGHTMQESTYKLVYFVNFQKKEEIITGFAAADKRAQELFAEGHYPIEAYYVGGDEDGESAWGYRG